MEEIPQERSGLPLLYVRSVTIGRDSPEILLTDSAGNKIGLLSGLAQFQVPRSDSKTPPTIAIVAEIMGDE